MGYKLVNRRSGSFFYTSYMMRLSKMTYGWNSITKKNTNCVKLRYENRETKPQHFYMNRRYFFVNSILLYVFFIVPTETNHDFRQFI